MAITDCKGTIIYANENFKEISGYSSEELIGANHRLLNSGKHSKAFWSKMYRKVAEGGVWREEVCNRAKSGEEYWVDTTISGMRDESGKIRQYVAIRFDITSRKAAEDELRKTKRDLENALLTADDLNNDLKTSYAKLLEANSAAESAAQAKGDFLANMSHEIRTPMNAIVGFAEILSDATDYGLSETQRKEYLHTICQQGKHLLRLINDILDLAKIESGRLRTERIAFRPESVLQDVSHVFSQLASAKGIELSTVTDSGVPTIIKSDPTRLQQILTNLVSNAIKFTDHGTVVIRLQSSSAEEHDAIEFVIQDSGVGMDQQTMSRLFSAFEQADASTTRKYGGTGLGLCICKRLATALGGEILVESELGLGSTFTVRLPLRLPEESLPEVCEAKEPSKGFAIKSCSQSDWMSESLHGVRVLLAEDSDDNAVLITHHLERSGAFVRRVANGLEAVELISGESPDANSKQRFDVVIMDMQMPVMDGYTATEHLRTRGFQTPIIAATAHAMADDQRKCLDAGCTDYISKPINRTDLMNKVLHAISKKNTYAA